MKKLTLIFFATGSAAIAEPVAVPSGQAIEFIQIIWSEASDAPSAVFRFLAPEIRQDGSGISYDAASEDIMFLCQNYALPRVLEANGIADFPLVISLSQEAIAFGDVNPAVTQFFESFIVRDEQCDWGGI